MPWTLGSCLLDLAERYWLHHAEATPPRTRTSEPPMPVDRMESEMANWEAAWIDLGGEG
jgi:hypothetical protein